MATTQYQIFCRYFNGDINKCVTNQTPVEWVSKVDYNALLKYCNDTTKHTVTYTNPVTQQVTTKQQTNRELYADLVKAITGKTKPVRWEKDFSIIEKECWDNFKRLEEIQALDHKNLMSYEICEIEPADEMQGGTLSVLRRLKVTRDLAHYDTISSQTNVSNPKYDMIFMYNGIGQVKGPVFESNCSPAVETEDYGQFDGTSTTNKFCRNAAANDSHQQPYVYYDNMRRVNFDIWFEHSIHASLISAMTKANELVNIVGKNNVKIGKVVPLDKFIQIV